MGELVVVEIHDHRPGVVNDQGASPKGSKIAEQGAAQHGDIDSALPVLNRGIEARHAAAAVDENRAGARAGGVVVEHKIDEGDPNEVGRVAAPAVVLERPPETISGACQRPVSRDAIELHRRDLAGEADVPDSDVGLGAIDRGPGLEPRWMVIGLARLHVEK